MMNTEIFKDALRKYREELEIYLDDNLETETTSSIHLDEVLIRLVLEDAAERLRLQNEKRRKGWKRTNDGQQDQKRGRYGDIIK